MNIVTISSSSSLALTDPREEMIQVLAEQNTVMLQELDKASSAFERYKSEQAQLTASLARTNEELCAALRAAEARIEEMNMLNAAAKKAQEEKEKLRAASLQSETQKILDLCDNIDTSQKSLPYCAKINTNKVWLQNCHEDWAIRFNQENAEFLKKVDDKYKNRTDSQGFLPKPEHFAEETQLYVSSIRGRVQTIQKAQGK